jgi:membrane protease YdiL (CAAX protease family)
VSTIPEPARDSAVSGSLNTLPFFLAAWTISTLALLPTIVAQRGIIAGPAERFVGLAPFAVFSPMLAAMLVSRFEAGGSGIRAVFRPLRDWSVRPAWYLLAFLSFPLTFFLGVAVYKLTGGSGEVQWFYPPQTPDRIAAMLMIPIGEEVGWRGFALPRLQQRYGPLKASLLLGLGWGLWHLPMFLMAGVPFGWLLLGMVLFLVPGSVIYSWVFNRTRGLLPVAIIMHVGIHTNNSMLTLPSNPVPFLVDVAAVIVVAAVLLAADRRVWRGQALRG